MNPYQKRAIALCAARINYNTMLFKMYEAGQDKGSIGRIELNRFIKENFIPRAKPSEDVADLTYLEGLKAYRNIINQYQDFLEQIKSPSFSKTYAPIIVQQLDAWYTKCVHEFTFFMNMIADRVTRARKLGREEIAVCSNPTKQRQMALKQKLQIKLMEKENEGLEEFYKFLYQESEFIKEISDSLMLFLASSTPTPSVPLSASSLSTPKITPVPVVVLRLPTASPAPVAPPATAIPAPVATGVPAPAAVALALPASATALAAAAAPGPIPPLTSLATTVKPAPVPPAGAAASAGAGGAAGTTGAAGSKPAESKEMVETTPMVDQKTIIEGLLKGHKETVIACFKEPTPHYTMKYNDLKRAIEALGGTLENRSGSRRRIYLKNIFPSTDALETIIDTHEPIFAEKGKKGAGAAGAAAASPAAAAAASPAAPLLLSSRHRGLHKKHGGAHTTREVGRFIVLQFKEAFLKAGINAQELWPEEYVTKKVKSR